MVIVSIRIPPPIPITTAISLLLWTSLSKTRIVDPMVDKKGDIAMVAILVDTLSDVVTILVLTVVMLHSLTISISVPGTVQLNFAVYNVFVTM